MGRPAHIGAAGWLPVWLQPLTRWPLIQDEHAYFSPSMRGMPGLSRPVAVVALASGGRAV